MAGLVILFQQRSGSLPFARLHLSMLGQKTSQSEYWYRVGIILVQYLDLGTVPNVYQSDFVLWRGYLEVYQYNLDCVSSIQPVPNMHAWGGLP